MLIYIVRHGDAGMATGAIPDSERKLTSKGELQAQRIGIALGVMDEVPEMVFTSPLARAFQTAAIVVSALAIKTCEPKIYSLNCLSLGASVGDVFREMPGGGVRSLMMVGHNPILGPLVGILVGGLHGSPIDLANGSIVCLETYGSPRPGAARLNYLLGEKAVAVIARSV